MLEEVEVSDTLDRAEEGGVDRRNVHVRLEVNQDVVWHAQVCAL